MTFTIVIDPFSELARVSPPMTPSDETVLSLRENPPYYTVRRDIRYNIEVDYPGYDDGDAWRSIEQHTTAEAAAAQWQRREPSSPYPCRIIETTSIIIERVVGDMV